MEAVVTGAAGYVGTNLIRLLVDRGHVVTAIDRVGPQRPTGPNITWVSGDVLDPAAMRPALAGAEIVYHPGRGDHAGRAE